MGAIEAGKEREAEIVFRGPHLADDYEAQLAILKTARHDRFDAIVLAPEHTTRAIPLLQKAVADGIRIVIMDSDTDFADRVTFVASDNYAAGRKAARHMLTLVSPTAPVLLVRHKEHNASTLHREMGFLDTMAAQGAPEHLIVTGYVGVSEGDAYHAILTALRKHPDIQGIFTSAEATTLGCVQAVEQLGLAGKVQVVGFDCTVELLLAMQKQMLQGLILQSPYRMGYRAVHSACDAVEGLAVPPRIITPTRLVTNYAQLLDYITDTPH